MSDKNVGAGPDGPAPTTHSAEVVTEYRVVCPHDGFVCLPAPLRDYQAAHDLRFARDAERRKASLHRDCGPHRVEERTVTYGEWR